MLGEAFDDGAAANCTVKSYKFLVPTFEGGDSFKTFAARVRVRSGMTAIDPAFCNANARSCGVMQDMLERSPGLVFVNGRFVHAQVFALAAALAAAAHPAPPPRAAAVRRRRTRAAAAEPARAARLTPPPYYAGRRAVHPAAAPRRLRPRHEHGRGQGRRERGARELLVCAQGLGRKAARVGVLRAHRLPVPAAAARAPRDATAEAASLRRQRERLGDLEAYPEPRLTDEKQWAQDSSNALKGTNALIDGLGENNPILRRSLLKGVKEELLRAEIEAVPDVTAVNTGNAAAVDAQHHGQRDEQLPTTTSAGTSTRTATATAGGCCSASSTTRA